MRVRWNPFRPFFSTFDRTVGSTSLVLTSISLLLTIFLVKAPDRVPQFIEVRDVTIVFGLMAAALFYAGKYIRREATFETQARLLARQYHDFRDIVRNYKNQLFREYFSDPGVYSRQEGQERVFRHLCGHITYGVRESFLQYERARGIEIGDDISVSVKLILKTDELLSIAGENSLGPDAKKRIEGSQATEWVTTVYRDPYTHRHHWEREKAQRVYDITRNTAFLNIVQHGQPEFVSNDLQALGQAYMNENSNWQQQYNATIVVPIGYSGDQEGQSQCWGLLAVDSVNNTKANLFDTDESRYIASHAADLLSTFFLLGQLAEADGNTRTNAL